MGRLLLGDGWLGVLTTMVFLRSQSMWALGSVRGGIKETRRGICVCEGDGWMDGRMLACLGLKALMKNGMTSGLIDELASPSSVCTGL